MSGYKCTFLLLLFQQVGREYLELDIGCYVCICHVVLGRLYDDYVNQIAFDAIRHGTVLTLRFLPHTKPQKFDASCYTHGAKFIFFYLTTLEYMHRIDQARNPSTKFETWTWTGEIVPVRRFVHYISKTTQLIYIEFGIRSSHCKYLIMLYIDPA
jgi:hypothetical protein